MIDTYVVIDLFICIYSIDSVNIHTHYPGSLHDIVTFLAHLLKYHVGFISSTRSRLLRTGGLRTGGTTGGTRVGGAAVSWIQRGRSVAASR